MAREAKYRIVKEITLDYNNTDKRPKDILGDIKKIYGNEVAKGGTPVILHMEFRYKTMYTNARYIHFDIPLIPFCYESLKEFEENGRSGLAFDRFFAMDLSEANKNNDEMAKTYYDYVVSYILNLYKISMKKQDTTKTNYIHTLGFMSESLKNGTVDRELLDQMEHLLRVNFDNYEHMPAFDEENYIHISEYPHKECVDPRIPAYGLPMVNAGQLEIFLETRRQHSKGKPTGGPSTFGE